MNDSAARFIIFMKHATNILYIQNAQRLFISFMSIEYSY
jgi:hypothetical protein